RCCSDLSNGKRPPRSQLSCRSQWASELDINTYPDTRLDDAVRIARAERVGEGVRMGSRFAGKAERCRSGHARRRISLPVSRPARCFGETVGIADRPARSRIVASNKVRMRPTASRCARYRDLGKFGFGKGVFLITDKLAERGQ